MIIGFIVPFFRQVKCVHWCITANEITTDPLDLALQFTLFTTIVTPVPLLVQLFSLSLLLSLSLQDLSPHFFLPLPFSLVILSLPFCLFSFVNFPLSF